MEKLDIKRFIDSGLSTYYNKGIFLLDNFNDIQKIKGQSLLVDGVLFGFVVKGAAQIRVGSETLQLGVGDAFSCNPRDMLQKTMLSMDFDARTIFFSSQYAEETASQLNLGWTLLMMSSERKVIHLEDAELRQLELYIALLRAKLEDAESPHTLESIKFLMGSMVYLMFDVRDRRGKSLPKQTYSSAEHLFQRFAHTLSDTNLPLRNVNEYARELSITPKYFSAICKQMTGKTAGRLITEETIQRAQVMLRDNKLNIKQIASALNFKNQSYFGRYFRLYVGVSPQRFRAQNP